MEISPDSPRPVKTRVAYKTAALVFHTFQLLYPLITFLVQNEFDKTEFVVYNIVCIMIGAIGFFLQCVELDQFFKDYKKIYNQFCGRQKASDDGVGCCRKCLKCYQQTCQCCPTVVRKVFNKAVKEILLYLALLCNLFGFINERTWRRENTLDYSLIFFYSFTVY